MRVHLAPPAKKDLDRLPDKIAFRVAVLIKTLETDAFPSSSKKLHGWQNTYRTRLGDYRVVYEVDTSHKIIIVTRIKHRKDVYR